MSKRKKLSPERVLEELVTIGFADVTDFLYIRDGQLQILSTDAFPKGASGAVAGVERGTGGLKLKFYDKLRALELLGKHFGLFDGTAGESVEPGVLEALLEQLKKEVDTLDLSELQQTSDPGDQLVAPPGPETI